MKKQFAAAILAAALSAAAAPALALDSVYLNNYDTHALRTVNGEPMLAVRSFFECAGYTVQWNSELSGVMIFDTDTRIGIYEGQSFICINDKVSRLSAAPSIYDGTLVMPLDAAVKALSAELAYRDNSAYLTSTDVNDCSAWQYEVLFLTNLERANAGLPSLVWNAELARLAEAHCADMAERGFFAHITPEGVTPLDRARSAGIEFTGIAENIAAGQPDPAAVVESWMNSPMHRENIMDPHLTELGIAYVRGGRYGIYWAQEFIAK